METRGLTSRRVIAKRAEAESESREMIVGTWDGMRIDVFFPSIEFAREAGRTKVQIDDGDGWSGWFLSAAALSVFKLLFFRTKDVADLERLVAVRPELDRDYVRSWIVKMMGEDDERTVCWDRWVAAFGAMK